MLKSLLQNEVSTLSFPKVSRLALAVSLALSLPYGHIEAAVYVQPVVDGEISGFSSELDFLVGASASNVNGGNLTVTENGIIRDADINFAILAGGYSNSGVVQNSSVTVNGSISRMKKVDLYGGYSSSANVNNNSSLIRGSFSNLNDLSIYGGYAKVNSEFNTVSIDGAVFTGINELNIVGGMSDNGSASNNTLKIKNVAL